jgi:Carboxypeptidase regulatory-like domain
MAIRSAVRLRASAGLGALICAAHPVTAQLATAGHVEGTVTDRVKTHSVRAASVEAVRLEPEPTVSFRVAPDERGRFRLESIPAGRYLIQLGSATLDSLELAMPASELNVEAGATAHTDLSLPLGDVLRDAVCAGVKLGRGRGAVAGRALDADTEEPLANAQVVVAWTDVRVDRKTLRPVRLERAGTVRTGSRGEYRVCGVPTDSWLFLQLQHEGKVGGLARVSVSDEEGAVVRNLSLSLLTAPTIVALDSLEELSRSLGADRAREDSIAAVRLAGTASVTGIVRSPAGQPLADAEVRVASAGFITTTGNDGRFSLGGLPAGTQLFYVRRLGYSTIEGDIELRAGRNVAHDVSLTRLVALDSVRVVAQRGRYGDFDQNRRTNFFAEFLTSTEIERNHPQQVTDLIFRMGGFAISGFGPDAKVISNRASHKNLYCTEANVVIDGAEHATANFLPVERIYGIEAYRDEVTAPAGMDARCGLIVLWTKEYHAKKTGTAPSDSSAVSPL